MLFEFLPELPQLIVVGLLQLGDEGVLPLMDVFLLLLELLLEVGDRCFVILGDFPFFHFPLIDLFFLLLLVGLLNPFLHFSLFTLDGFPHFLVLVHQLFLLRFVYLVRLIQVSDDSGHRFYLFRQDFLRGFELAPQPFQFLVFAVNLIFELDKG